LEQIRRDEEVKSWSREEVAKESGVGAENMYEYSSVRQSGVCRSSGGKKEIGSREGGRCWKGDPSDMLCIRREK
jgi:hypothetical protein